MTNTSPAHPASTESSPPAPNLRARATLRSSVAVAARILPTHYPLRTFIAVNPLDGLKHLPFDTAAFRAGELYGATAALPEGKYRDYFSQGRISTVDLDHALARRYPQLGSEPPLASGGKTFSAFDILRADLLAGAPAPEPVRVYRTRSEQIAPSVADQVNELSSRWCAAYLTTDSTAWAMPEHPDGFFASWRALAYRDPTLNRSVRAALRNLPERADDAALIALNALGVADSAYRDYATAHLTQQPGWPSHIRWHNDHTAPVRITMFDYLAIRLTYEALLLAGHQAPATPATTLTPEVAERPAHLPARASHALAALGITSPLDTDITRAIRLLGTLPVKDRTLVWVEAFEFHYRDALLKQMPATDVEPASTASGPRPAAQIVNCIDTRSEGLRRHLEVTDKYQTLGFAGFFFAAIRFTDLAQGDSNDLCPVLIKPSFVVSETPAPGADLGSRKRLAGLQTLTGAHNAFHSAKDDSVSPYALAEASGWLAGPASAARTLAPRVGSAIARFVRRQVAPAADTQISLEDGFGIADRVNYARVALSTMGLIRNFARLVVFCAHGSTTSNNPYQASLDCGACGGQRGGPTARTAALIFNDPEVRVGLREHNINIPADTVFISAEHDTATDRVVILDEYAIPPSHRAELDELCADLAAAGEALTAERSALLPYAPGRARKNPAVASRHASTRSADWAQVYPEWGLVGNAAFIIGPRAQTYGIDLERRAFLHSYLPQDDQDGSVLETILTAPLVVAQWINAQYYFSTVAPDIFGAGSKTIHNVLGGVGVLAGHAGDLQLGLPWQSVAVGDTLIHEPMRLLTVIHAPTDRIDTIVERNPILQELLHGEWFTFTAPDYETGTWKLRTAAGWQSWSGPSN
ncbi:DUF2309 domain-containing protein [Nakamurella antarctica]|uniref:Probable inorganic carbon transporter subunit DabA n=1 Tax=Nakamurella antarctica TaxID=1902245 RepID=A0A3G8ZX99_9ACTN|nr:DUF2309 domain-containing protein [Nakamurella antarctica]AZI58291.1 DUF2309 domain-containing protein [Nakamurella antarctica]